MPEISPSKYVVNAGWDQAPHLDEKTKTQMLAATPPFMRGARASGLPSKGAGAIYPVDRSAYVVKPFAIPADWPRGYGMDIGWKCTTAQFFALDENSQVYYLYAEHYMGMEKPVVHAEAIKARGSWIPGWIDPASRGRGQDDGERLLAQYQGHGLKLRLAENAVESGIIKIWQLLTFGRLKVFETCAYALSELEHYRRDENGKVLKKNDHAMDAWRYFFNSGSDARLMKRKPADQMLSDAGGFAAGHDSSGY
jgi:hypothetical protein